MTTRRDFMRRGALWLAGAAVVEPVARKLWAFPTNPLGRRPTFTRIGTGPLACPIVYDRIGQCLYIRTVNGEWVPWRMEGMASPLVPIPR